MNIGDIFKDASWYFRNRDLIGRVIGNPDVLALIDAAKELGDGSAPDSPQALHEAATNANVDTRALAEAIHPVGPESSGNPDAFNAGSNNANV